MIELPRNKPETRPFNREHAIVGAPVITSLGFRARIICWNMNDDGVRDLIVVLVKRYQGSNQEELITVDSDGKGHGRMSSLGDLCMAPVATVEGKAVFTGDVVYQVDGRPTTVHFATWPPFKETDMNQYKLNPPPIMFEGKPLLYTDSLWYRMASDAPWSKIQVRDVWANPAGMVESHFEYLKRNIGRESVATCYTRKSPYNLVLEGKPLELGDKIWYKHPTSRGISMELTAYQLDLFETGKSRVENYTRDPASKVELWQAKVTLKHAPVVISVSYGEIYPSQEDCDKLAPKELPPEYVFLKSEKISEYWK